MEDAQRAVLLAASPLRLGRPDVACMKSPQPHETPRVVSCEDITESFKYMTSTIQTLGEENTELRCRLEASEQRLDEARQETARAELQIVQEQKVNQKQSGEILEITARSAEAKQDADRRQTALEAESAALRAELARTSEVNKDADRRQTALEAESASLRAELAAERVAANRQKSYAEQLVAEVEQTQRDAEQQRQNHAEEIAAMQVSLASAWALASLREAEVTDLRKSLAKCQEDLACTTLLHQDLQGMNADSCAEVSELRHALDEQHEIQAASDEKLAALKAEVDGQAQAMEAEQSTAAVQREEIHRLEQVLIGVQEKAEQQRKVLEEQSRSGIADARSRTESVTLELESCRASALHLQQEVSVLRQALEEEKDRQKRRSLEQKDFMERLYQAEEVRALDQQRYLELEMQFEGAMQASGAQAGALRAEADELRVELLDAETQIEMWQHRAEAAKRQLNRRNAEEDADDDLSFADSVSWEEIIACPEGHLEEKLRIQNRELIMTIRQFKQDCELLEAENSSLSEAVAICEDDLHRVTDRHAQLLGHNNQKQKIRYTMKLKEEINRLNVELRKSRRRIIQLEVGRESESLIEALASVAAAQDNGPRRKVGQVSSKMQRHSTPGTGGRSHRGGLIVEDGDEHVRLAEVERRWYLQQLILESISVDFQHVKMLIERVIVLADSERRCGGPGCFAHLLQRLREVIAAAHRSPGASPSNAAHNQAIAAEIPCLGESPASPAREVIVPSIMKTPERYSDYEVCLEDEP